MARSIAINENATRISAREKPERLFPNLNEYTQDNIPEFYSREQTGYLYPTPFFLPRV